MKPFASLFTGFVLTVALLTGCGCTNKNAGGSTGSSSQPSTQMTTMPTTTPTEMSTMPTMSEPTINHGNGPLTEESTGASESTAPTTASSRSRNMPIR